MKIIRYIFFGLLIFLICGGIYGAIISESNRAFEANYDPTMQKLNYATAMGSKIAGYEVEDDKYTSKYIPSDLLAKNVEDVGYVLKLTYSTTSQLYTGYHRVSGTIIDAQLVQCNTGNVIAERTFKPYFPYSISSNVHSVNVPETTVSNWVMHMFPEGPGSDHDWKEATCVSAKRCSMCDLTEGVPLPHDWVDGKCSYCLTTKDQVAQGMEEPTGHEHQIKWSLNEENAAEMYGTCSECGQYIDRNTDWEMAGPCLILGRWKASKGGKGGFTDAKPLPDHDVYLQIRQDGTAVLEYEDTEIPMTWRMKDHSFNEQYPRQYQVSYSFQKEDGGYSSAFYTYDDYINMTIDGYTLIFNHTFDAESFDHTVDNWQLDLEDVRWMYGTCSDCGEKVTSETDWFTMGPALLPGTYNAHMYTVEDKDGHTLLEDGALTLEVNEDGTASLIHGSKVYPYTWGYTDCYTTDSHPHMFDCYYSFRSKNNTEYEFSYGNSIMTMDIGKYTIFFDK